MLTHIGFYSTRRASSDPTTRGESAAPLGRGLTHQARSGKDIGGVVSAFAGASSALRTQRGPVLAGRCMCMTDSRSDSERTAGSSEQSPQTARDCRPGGGSNTARRQEFTVAANDETELDRKGGQDRVATVVGLSGNLDAALMDHDQLLIRVVSPDSDGGTTITDGEGRLMRQHFYDAVSPAGLNASDGLSVMRSIASSDDGVCGEMPVARITHIWERRMGRTARRVLDGGKKEATAS